MLVQISRKSNPLFNFFCLYTTNNLNIPSEIIWRVITVWNVKEDVFSSCHERGKKKNFWVPMRKSEMLFRRNVCLGDEQGRRFLNHECQIILHKGKWIIFPSSNTKELLKVEPVSNGDWLKSFRLFLGLGAEENSNKTQLTSSAFSAP